MERNPPYLFEGLQIIDDGHTLFSADNGEARLVRVRVFSKYENRNGSYITEAVA